MSGENYGCGLLEGDFFGMAGTQQDSHRVSIEFSGGFTDLHTLVYRDILEGRGFGLEDARAAINLVYELRNAKAHQVNGEHAHPLIENFRS